MSQRSYWKLNKQGSTNMFRAIKISSMGVMLCTFTALFFGNQIQSHARTHSESIVMNPLVGQVEIGSVAKLVTDIGIMASLVLFFTWTAWKREERLANRITALETFAQTDLINVGAASTEAIRDNTKAILELSNVLHMRPCLLETKIVAEQFDRIVGKWEEKLLEKEKNKGA